MRQGFFFAVLVGVVVLVSSLGLVLFRGRYYRMMTGSKTDPIKRPNPHQNARGFSAGDNLD
ncbi:MAG: hypothetical protein ACE366_13070 [Bradymonadia bacterium]